ncbi:MAG: major capsid family protein [Pseudomonadota bacterium]
MKIQVFQAGDVPGAASFAAAAAQVGYSPGLRQDSLVYPQELTQLAGKYRELYRPRKWRRYLGVEQVSSWAQQIEDRRYTSQMAEPVNLTNKAPTQELPLPSISTTNQFLPIYEFGTAYAVMDRDIELAAKVGVSLSDEYVQAVNLSIEMFFEKVASVGHTANGVTMKGLGNLPDIGTATASTKTGGGLLWTSAGCTAAEIVTDLHEICNAVELASLENDECSLILIPLAAYQKANQKRTDSLERSALSIFRQERPGVDVQVWNKLSDQGSANTGCAIGFSKGSPFAPKMLMQRELQFQQALRGTNGWLVPGKIALGGVRCLAPQNVIKMSGITPAA